MVWHVHCWTPPPGLERFHSGGWYAFPGMSGCFPGSSTHTTPPHTHTYCLRQGSCRRLHWASQAMRHGSQPASPSRWWLTPCHLGWLQLPLCSQIPSLQLAHDSSQLSLGAMDRGPVFLWKGSEAVGFWEIKLLAEEFSLCLPERARVWTKRDRGQEYD